jgi:teichuronopeptide biosynthesis TupA-like protein
MDGIVQLNKGSSVLRTRFRNLFWRVISPLPDGPYLYLKYASIFGRFPKLKNPSRFSELQHLRKLHDRNPLYPVIVDKYEAKGYIKERVGAEHVVPTYWVGTNLAEVDWSKVSLPAVVKPTHASGAGFFLKSQEDIQSLMRRRPEKDWLAQDHFKLNREWAYKDVPRRIIIEKMLGEPGEILIDYRFFCFDGKTVHIETRTPKDSNLYEAIYTPDWQKLDLHGDHYPVLPGVHSKPKKLDKMLGIVSKISSGIRFARVDLYSTAEGLFVGEVTLYPSGGFETFVPDSYDVELGTHWGD